MIRLRRFAVLAATADRSVEERGSVPGSFHSPTWAEASPCLKSFQRTAPMMGTAGDQPGEMEKDGGVLFWDADNHFERPDWRFSSEAMKALTASIGEDIGGTARTVTYRSIDSPVLSGMHHA